MLSDSDNVMSVKSTIPACSKDGSDYSSCMYEHLDKHLPNDKILCALWKQICQKQKIDFGDIWSHFKRL